MNPGKIYIAILFLFGLPCQKDSLLDEPLYLKLNMNDSVFVREYNPFNGSMGFRYGFSSSLHVGYGYGASSYNGATGRQMEMEVLICFICPGSKVRKKCMALLTAQPA